MENKLVPIEISARHVHLSDVDLENLFGKDYQLRVDRKISQPGQFAAKEKVSIKTNNGELSVRVIGPTRDQTQVELAVTDCIKLGIKPEVRLSGDLVNTPGCILVGPKSEAILTQGVMVAQRHLHINPEQAEQYNLKNDDVICIKVGSSRKVIFHQVIVRCHSGVDELSFMIDTDEANAAGLIGGEQGEIIIR
ncbi:MAG: phosphate propanoyltransferase [Patescibacteria group bacterium]